jgi:hypothetical protein
VKEYLETDPRLCPPFLTGIALGFEYALILIFKSEDRLLAQSRRAFPVQ